MPRKSENCTLIATWWWWWWNRTKTHDSKYKNLFLRKNQTDHARHLIWPECKKEKEPQTIRHQKTTFSFCRELLLRLSVRIRGPNWWHEKLELTDGFRHSLLEWSFPRNKTKIKWKSTTEILPSQKTERKFNQEFCWKEPLRRFVI